MSLKIIMSILWFFEVIKWLMLGRAMISWLPDLNDSKITKFLDDVTEPLIAPIRNLISRTKLAELPIDMSFLIVYLILEIMTSFIRSTYGIM